jgi:hypothetical protein
MVNGSTVAGLYGTILPASDRMCFVLDCYHGRLWIGKNGYYKHPTGGQEVDPRFPQPGDYWQINMGIPSNHFRIFASNWYSNDLEYNGVSWLNDPQYTKYEPPFGYSVGFGTSEINLNTGSGATPERALIIDLSEGVGSVNGSLKNTCYMYDNRFYQTAYLLQGVSGSGSAGKIDSIPNTSKTSNTLSIGGFNFSLVSGSFDGQMDLVLLDGLYYLVVWNYWPLDDGSRNPESNNFTILVA